MVARTNISAPPAATSPTTPAQRSSMLPPASVVGTAPAIKAPAAISLGTPPALETFGDAAALKAKANKLLKSVQLIEPRVCNPAEGTQAPFMTAPTTSTTTASVGASSAETASHASAVRSEALFSPEFTPPEKQTVGEVVAAQTAHPTTAPLPIPLVDKNFSPNDVTPRQLQAAAQNYQTDPSESIHATLQQANFIPPVNPVEYLPARQEEEMQNASDPALAAERAALGPKGLQGGNPAFAMAQGSPLHSGQAPADAFERARDQALKEERLINAKNFVNAIQAQEGPTPDAETLELLKSLKPETEEKK